MKKIIALCLAVILAASLAACGSAESSAGSAAAVFGDCQTVEDFISAAKNCLDKGDVYMANEAVRAGYVKTGDDSLRLLPLSGKPTVESTVVLYRLGMSTDAVPSACCMQYFLGKEIVLACPALPPLYVSQIPLPMFVYTFHPQTHRLQAIEDSDFLSFDKLDNDLINLSFAASQGAGSCMLYNSSNSYEETMTLNHTFRFSYTEDGTLCGVSCGDIEATISKTATGYTVTLPEDSISSNNARSFELNIDLQEGKIVYMNDRKNNKTETLSYQSDGSCTAKGVKKYDNGESQNATVTYNKDNLADNVAYNDTNYTITYNDRQMPVKITETSKNETNEYNFSYDSKGNLQTQTDKNNNISYLYDDAGRLVKYIDGSESHAISYDSNNRIKGIEDRINEFEYRSDNGKLNSFYDPKRERRYSIIRDADGFVLGWSYTEEKQSNEQERRYRTIRHADGFAPSLPYTEEKQSN